MGRRVVHVYNWTDYIGETTLDDFRKATGIKAVYDTYDFHRIRRGQDARRQDRLRRDLHPGSTLQRFVEAGVFQKLDKSKLPNWTNLDPEILKVIQGWDPGNQYGVPYMWGTVGITYNLDMVKQRLADNAPLSSLDILFKPEYAAKLADCGISVLESPSDVIPMVLKYLGKDPDTANPADFEAVVEAFKPIRQYIKTFDPRTISTRSPTRSSASSTTGRATMPPPGTAPRKPASRSTSPITCPTPARPPGSTCGPSRRTRRTSITPINSSITCWIRKSSPNARTSPTTPMPTFRSRKFTDKAVLDDPAVFPSRTRDDSKAKLDPNAQRSHGRPRQESKLGRTRAWMQESKTG